MNKLKLILVAALLSVFAVSANAQQSDNVVTATYGNATGNTTRTMTVALNHATDYVAFYLNLTLPEGTTVKGVTAKAPLITDETIDLSERGGSATESQSFNVPFRPVSDTKCNIVGYNYANMAIGGTSGDILLTVTLETEEGIAYDANAITTACTFVDENATEYALEPSVTEARLWGDVNMDGKVNATDYQAMANIVTNKGNGSAKLDSFAADINQDGGITAIDYQAEANIITNK